MSNVVFLIKKIQSYARAPIFQPGVIGANQNLMFSNGTILAF
jgi:hypothetical protein